MSGSPRIARPSAPWVSATAAAPTFCEIRLDRGLLARARGNPTAITVDSTSVYWTNFGNEDTRGSVPSYDGAGSVMRIAK